MERYNSGNTRWREGGRKGGREGGREGGRDQLLLIIHNVIKIKGILTLQHYTE